MSVFLLDACVSSCTWLRVDGFLTISDNEDYKAVAYVNNISIQLWLAGE